MESNRFLILVIGANKFLPLLKLILSGFLLFDSQSSMLEHSETRRVGLQPWACC